MQNLRSLLVDWIGRAGRSFANGELAYLALTSKIERPLLDRIAFSAQRVLQGGAMVGREFSIRGAGRADVAILENGRVRCVIEGKAMAVADCTRTEPKRREYAERMEQDLEKYRNAPLPGAEIFCLLFGVHPLSRIPSELVVVKYLSLLNSAYTRLGSAECIYEDADRNLQSYLRDGLLIASGVLEGGVAFGIPVEIRWWCYGPFRSPSELAILRGNAA